jgi:aminobenzoyl-glutamate transport protein
VAVALMVVPENGILRDPIKHTDAFAVYKGIVPLIIFFFFVVSLATASPPAKFAARPICRS